MTGRKHRNARERDAGFRDAPERSQRPYRDDADAYGPRRRYTQDDRGYGEDDWAQPEPRPVYPAARPEDRGEYEGEGYGQREYGSRGDRDLEGGHASRGGYAGEPHGGERYGRESWETERYGEDFRGRRGRREQQEPYGSGGWGRGSYPDDYRGGSFASGGRSGPGPGRREGRGPLPRRGGWSDESGSGPEEDSSYYRGYYARRAQPYYTSSGESGMLVSEAWSLDGPYSGRGPKGYKRSDEQIVEEVSRRLERDGGIDASEIEVSCNDGVVTLKGKVGERRMKRSAEECIEDVYGVKDVMNQVQVDRDLSSRSDREEGSSGGDEGRQEPSKRMKQERATR